MSDAIAKFRFYLALLLFLAVPDESWAGLKGDRELLKKAAVSYRSNLERLRTWKGTAEYKMQSDDQEPF